MNTPSIMTFYILIGGGTDYPMATSIMGHLIRQKHTILTTHHLLEPITISM